LGGIQRFALSLESICGDKYNYIKFHDNIPEKWRNTRRSKFTWNIFRRDGVINTGKVLLFITAKYVKYVLLLIKAKPQLVHILSSNNLGFFRNCVYLIIARQLRIKIIFHHLGQFDDMIASASNWMLILIRGLLDRADSHVTQSDALSILLRRYTKKPVFTLWNPVKTPGLTNRRVCQGSEINVYSVGYLGNSKGTDLLLNMSASYKELLLDNRIKFNVIGGGDMKYYLEKINKDKISALVTLHGVLSDEEKFRHLLNEADIFLMPSRAEGQPIALLEAMACGLPTIATAVGSIPEVLGEGRGKIVEKESVDEIIKAIELYINRPNEREETIRNSLAYVISTHSESSFKDKMTEITTCTTAAG